MTTRHPEDSTRYEQLLESTRDSEGVCHRDEAVKLLTDELVDKADRLSEYATARANQVADGFDRTHQPEVDDGQMVLDVGNYLVIGESERIQVDQAMTRHTRLWLDVQTLNKARLDASYAAKTMHGFKLLKIQDEHECSMWKAEQILRGETP